MKGPILRPFFNKHDPCTLMEKEWLVTNGLGGYASNSLACIPTRKYHGFLIAALPHLGRTLMLPHLLEVVELPDGTEVFLNLTEKPERGFDQVSMAFVEDFYLESGLPVWKFDFNGTKIEKRLVMTYEQNTVHVIYTVLTGEKINLKLFPFIHFRRSDDPADMHIPEPVITVLGDKYEIAVEGFPSLKLYATGNDLRFSLSPQRDHNVFLHKEAMRGYPAMANMWRPGYFLFRLEAKQTATFLASTESWQEIMTMNSQEALHAERYRKELLLHRAPDKIKSDLGQQLILAADQFIITPGGRVQDRIRANAVGDEVRTVIAGYHWFGDWGRDTMISLEGLTMCTGRLDESKWILRTFSYYVKNGLIPNLFPEGKEQGLYHTADATLWLFQALNAYIEKTKDFDTLRFIFPKLREIYHAHVKGTLFGIHVDPEDGLLIQGAEGYQLTWMDAKVKDWVVTPRRGKAVEINALWYNALRIFEQWLKIEDETLSKEVGARADKVYASFNKKFWNPEKKSLYDIVEKETGGPDDAVRPNQLFSISLRYPVLDPVHWKPVFETTKEKLFTSVGLRSLEMGHPDFKEQYHGDLFKRDAAYHQGTVWSWLTGPYIDAWLKIYPDEKEQVMEVLNGYYVHLLEAGIGFISEIFDAKEPHTPRGCIAQAWSIAELLRCLLKIT